MPALVVKKLFPEFPLVAGKTATFVKQSGSRAAALSEISEGAEIMMDYTPYTTITVTPYKKGARQRISRENIEDLYIPIIEDQLRRLARRMAYTIDKDCQSVIDAGAGNSITATGTSLGATGTEFTITGGLGTKDILKAKAAIEGYNLIPDSILLNPINARDVMYLPQFSLHMQYGEPVIQTGIIGTIYGMAVMISTVIPAGTAYILSTGQNLSAAYSPPRIFRDQAPIDDGFGNQKRVRLRRNFLDYKVQSRCDLWRSNREMYRFGIKLNNLKFPIFFSHFLFQCSSTLRDGRNKNKP